MTTAKSRLVPFALFYLSLLGPGEGYSNFKPNCTLPPPGTNYVGGPNVRSTLTILWNCLSIIILCTWSIQHLNVPAIRPAAKGMVQTTWWAILDLGTKVKWMLITVLVPEIVVGKALGEWMASKATDLNGKPHAWGPVHIYMANMGYFVLDMGNLARHMAEEGDSGQRPDSSEEAKSSNDVSKDSSATETNLIKAIPQSIIDAADEKCVSTSSQINLSRLKWRYWALNCEQWYYLFDKQLIEPPDIAESQLVKLDRGGKLVKVLALIQVTYLIIQLIGRKIEDLPSAQIEIAALAFAACSIVTYLLYWNRPQGVETVYIVKPEAKISKILPELHMLASWGPAYLWLEPRSQPAFYPELGPVPIPNDASHYTDVKYLIDTVVWVFGALFGGALFGGLHCLAWNFSFPTPGEALGWRICSIATTCIPVVSVLPATMWIHLNPEMKEKTGSTAFRLVLCVIGVGMLLVPYVLARIFLMVEIFRTLLYLPPEAFVDTWSGSFPHIG